MRPAVDADADRLDLLRATLAAYLAHAEGRPPGAARVEALLDRWPAHAADTTPLPERLRAHLVARSAGLDADLVALQRALARALADRALADVEREAARAGHAPAFAALFPWLHRPVPTDRAAAIAAMSGLAPAAIDAALRRLRGRYRQRIAAGLALCSNTAQGRAELRRQLHAAVLDLEASR
jgi:hypothetical protein